MLENEIHMEQFLEIDIGIVYDTIYDCEYDENGCWSCENDFKKEGENNPVIRDYSHLTSKFGGLAHRKRNSCSRKIYALRLTLFALSLFVFFLKN